LLPDFMHQLIVLLCSSILSILLNPSFPHILFVLGCLPYSYIRTYFTYFNSKYFATRESPTVLFVLLDVLLTPTYVQYYSHTTTPILPYEFSLPFGSYVKTCTSFYVFSGPKWPRSRVGYWTPIEIPHRSSASHRWMPPPPHH
jgi:hypothetical protein